MEMKSSRHWTPYPLLSIPTALLGIHATLGKCVEHGSQLLTSKYLVVPEFPTQLSAMLSTYT